MKNTSNNATHEVRWHATAPDENSIGIQNWSVVARALEVVEITKFQKKGFIILNNGIIRAQGAGCFTAVDSSTDSTECEGGAPMGICFESGIREFSKKNVLISDYVLRSS
jgi:hypothetical protein